MLARLEPKKIVIVSSAPQIRFPDCYGIDMSKMSEFIAFRAMIALIKDTNQEHLLGEVYERAKWALENGDPVNHVNNLYNQFTPEEISGKIAEIVKPKDMNAELEVVYQKVDNLHKACPNHSGDWYFTGNFPTPGGMRVANRSFVNYMEGKMVRAY
jgi:amidophosphoribosyltransferase